MKTAGYSGTIYPVNPSRKTVQGLTAYPGAASLPADIDAAIISLPAPLVVETARGAAARGVRICIIFSSGFAEASEEGAALQEELSRVARDTGMRIFGPNCLGLFDAETGFFPTFTSSIEGQPPQSGPLSIISQSGAFGSHLFYLARERGVGIRFWLTTGNECDVDTAECIGWLADDPGTRVIMAYAEGIKNGPALIESLKKARAAGKPVIFMKVGGSDAGALAAQSHTASLAGADNVYDAVFRQYGVHRPSSTEELIDVVYAASKGIFPPGNKIGIVTISGGAGVMMADAASACGLDVSPMPDAAQAKLKKILPFAGVRNPVDITAQAFNDLDLVRQNMQLMLGEGGYDMVVVFFTMVASAPTIADPLREALMAEMKGHEDKLMALSILGPDAVKQRYLDNGILIYEDPNRAIAAFAALTMFRKSFDGAKNPATPTIPDQPPLPDGPLGEHEAKAILGKAGLPMMTDRLAKTPEEAADAAAKFDGPLALKIASPDILHKTEAGGVRLGVAPADAVAAAEDILAAANAHAPQARIDGILVSPMVAGGIEIIMGTQTDPVFGPVVMFGLGGIHVEIFKDVTFRIAPFDPAEALSMIRAIKGFALLEGVRGEPPCDIGAIAKALSALSLFAAAHGDTIQSIDLNPVRVGPKGMGLVALDASIVRSGET